MRIFLIPIEKTEKEIRTGDWHQAIYHILSQEHKVVGIVRPRWQSLKGKSKNFTLLYSWLKVFLYGLTHTYDLIYGVNTPSAFVGLILSLLRNKPLIWDAGNPALFNPGKLQWLLFRLEKLIAKRAIKIRMISEPYAMEYIRKGFELKKMVIVPHLVNLEMIDKALEAGDVKKAIALNGEKIVMFMGQGKLPTNEEAIRWLDSILQPLAGYSRVKFIVCGCAKVENCPNTTFLGYVPNIYQYIKACDVAVVPIWKESGAAVPTSRVIDFLACGRTVILTPFLWEELPELIDGVNCYMADSKKEFAKKLRLALWSNPQTVGEKARELIRENYTWDRAQEWVKLLK